MAEAGARNRDETTTVSGASGGRALHEADGHARVARQVEAPCTGRLTDLDRNTLAAHLADRAIGDRRELRSRLAVMIARTLEGPRHRTDRIARLAARTKNGSAQVASPN